MSRTYNRPRDCPFPTTLYTCTKLGYLDLSQNLFVGELPSDINGLSSSLTDLILSANNFSGQIPTSIGELKSIQSLYLDDNLFNGSIPVELAHLSDLQTLALAYNNFAPQRIPAEFGNLTGLSFLWMASMDLVGEIPGSFERLIELQQLDLSMNSLTGNIPNFIWNLRNLQFVYLLYSNKLTGVLPPELGKHCPLWNLEIDDNLLSGELPEDLCARNALASIIVFDNNFTGKIPESLGGCIALDNLQLQRNRFYGDFPPGIWSAANLSTVMLSDNNFSGTIPDKLPWNLTRLEIQNNRFSGKIPSAGENILVFLAGNNLFSGEIPAILTGISQLQSLQLGRNMISGSIPDEISVLKFLTELNLSNNQLIGEIPASIGSLPVLTTLDLSKNQLTGNIPVNIGNLRLNFLNLSSNQLSGQVPFAFQNQAYDKSFLSNPSLCSSDSALSLSRCDHQSKTSNTISPGVRTMIIVLALLLFLIVSGFTFFVIKDYKSRKDEQNLASWKLTSFHTLDFNESNIVKALTDENLIGAGGSGEVYKVAIGNRSGEVVAVKKIRSKTKMDSKLEREFVSEVQILGSIRHTNIVKLWCCISTLDWPRRLGIAIGAARGLCYMHHDCSPSIVHRDVKSSNILLDSEFRAKVADFGLARILVKAGEPCSVTAVAGSFGYMAPECAYAVKVNEKMDVYSFGVVLLELTTGREANEGDEQGGLAGWAWHHFLTGKNATDAIDETIKDPSNLDEIVKVLKLGLVCTGTLPSTRPTMKEAVEILLRCNRTSWNGSKPQAEHDIAPLLCSVRGSRHKSDSSTDDDLDDCNV
ncbi:uncharacterized protein A4U43_C05F26820 [Asparagus officinalis]|uniref:Protein kinase domain-containing protein n=1 Tax=Asparagus officinalis TaxID=4686 RepID=A0A5P1EUR5_ASPOF|nr:uncharacterized protein A4U43_C05F26820 [Asparagus officinalis]